tara:strand:- start:22740 stop:23768 length:1029 start_codon:yes stop_codon:yes gene_type:complete
MKAASFQAIGQVTISDKKSLNCDEGGLIIKPKFASLCASDIRVFRGEKNAKIGITPGHEFSGVIVDKHKNIKSFNIGDKVTLCPIISCGNCNFCLDGLRNRCLDRITLGYDLDGGFAEEVYIPKKIIELGHLFHLSENTDLKIAALVEPLSCTLNSIHSIGLEQQHSILILGGGPMGLMHAILATHLGVTNITIVEPIQERRELANQLGVQKVIDPQLDWQETLLDGSPEGFDKVIVSVGLETLLEPALQLCKKKGFINLFAGFPAGQKSVLDVNLIHYNELKLIGTQNASLQNYMDILKIIDQLDNIDKLITHVYKLKEVPSAYQDRANLKGVKSIIDFNI